MSAATTTAIAAAAASSSGGNAEGTKSLGEHTVRECLNQSGMTLDTAMNATVKQVCNVQQSGGGDVPLLLMFLGIAVVLGLVAMSSIGGPR